MSKLKGAAVLAFIVAGIGAAVASAGGGNSEPKPRPPGPDPEPWTPDPEPEPIDPDPTTDPEAYMLPPGWYWYFLDWATEREAFTDMQRANTGVFVVRKTMGHEATGRYYVIVFEVVGEEPIAWTLAGIPTPAPKGMNTTITDLEQGPPPEQIPEWAQWLKQMGKQAIETTSEFDQRFQGWLNQILNGGQ